MKGQLMTVKEIRDLENRVNAHFSKNEEPALQSLTVRKIISKGSSLSTGCRDLNIALSGHPECGFVRGRIVEIYGPEQSGKTTLCIHVIVEAQRQGLPVAFIDAEHALDPTYAEQVGVNLDLLSINQPDSGEQALAVTEECLKQGYQVLIIDSVAALTPKAELEGEMGASHIGLQARLMGQAMRKLTGLIRKQNALVIFTNQIRLKVGVMFGNPETTSGGMALKFYASYRIEVRSPRGEAVKASKAKKTLGGSGEDIEELGVVSNFKVVKNKVFPPYRKAKGTVIYGKGYDKYIDLARALKRAGVFLGDKGKNTGRIHLEGASFTYNTLVEGARASKKVRKAALKLLRQKYSSGLDSKLEAQESTVEVMPVEEES